MRTHLALTGGIASGKSYVSHELGKNELFTIIDADVISREVTSIDGDATIEIGRVFGPQYLDNNGALNRPLMRELVFNDALAKEKLETIIHPMIRLKMHEMRANCTTAYCVSVIPLLVESYQANELDFDRILVVDTTKEEQVKRLTQNRNLKKDMAERIINSQASRTERLVIADDVIYNEQSLVELERATRLLMRWYGALVD